MRFVISLLARLELGVFLFCDRKREEAAALGLDKLAQQLERHAAQELGHHIQLLELIGVAPSAKKFKWAKQYSSGIHSTYDPSKTVDSAWCPEGISRRYLSVRVWLRGQRACDLIWEDAIAFMCVGEQASEAFYSRMSKIVPSEYSATFERISQDEKTHQSQLYSSLKKISSIDSQQLLAKWRRRGYQALMFVPIDFAIAVMKWAWHRLIHRIR